MDRSLGDGGMALLGRLGVSFERYGEGWVEATWVPTEDACNPAGPVHGGVYAVVHDAAMNFATNSALEKGERGATISITYSTMRAASGGDPLAVRGEVVRLARQIAYLETTITNAEGELVSKASGTFILRRKVAAMTKTVVVGGGIMGAGIAYEARVAGFPVTLVESKPELLETARSARRALRAAGTVEGRRADGLRLARSHDRSARPRSRMRTSWSRRCRRTWS